MAQTTTQTGARGTGAETPDAIALLKADHRKVEELFASFENARGAERKQKLVQQICLELKIHTVIEEEIFYPACRGKIEDDMVDEAYVEHDAAKKLISELEASEPNEDFYDAKVKVLQEEIEHHVEEEEKRAEGMFAQAKKAGLPMDELGSQMSMRKEQLLRDAKGGIEPPSEPTTFKQ
jgi:hemerythrin superfamily protein